MPDSEQKKQHKKTTVQVSPALLLEIINEQNKLLNAGGRKFTQGELLQRAWECYKASSDRPPDPTKGEQWGQNAIELTEENLDRLAEKIAAKTKTATSQSKAGEKTSGRRTDTNRPRITDEEIERGFAEDDKAIGEGDGQADANVKQNRRKPAQ